MLHFLKIFPSARQIAAADEKDLGRHSSILTNNEASGETRRDQGGRFEFHCILQSGEGQMLPGKIETLLYFMHDVDELTALMIRRCEAMLKKI